MNNLKRKRKTSGLTQQKIAEETGISLRAYQNYESGARVPNANTAVLIAKALNTTVEKLFSEVTL